jgi:hypothetical protein
MKTILSILLVLVGLAAANSGDTAVADTTAYRVDTCNGNKICRYVQVKIHPGTGLFIDSARAARMADSARAARMADSARAARMADSARGARMADSAKTIRANPTITGVATHLGTGGGTPAPLSGVVIQSYGTRAGYLQNNIQNLSTDTAASSDWIVTSDNGTDSTYYGDFGCNGSHFAQGKWTINGASDCYLYPKGNGKSQPGGNLAIGTADTGKAVTIFTGGTLAANARLTLSDTVATFFTPIAMRWRAVTATKDTAYALDAIMGFSGATADTIQLLPTVVGRVLRIKRTDSNTTAHLVLGTIDGNSSYIFSLPYESIELVAVTSSTFAIVGGH